MAKCGPRKSCDLSDPIKSAGSLGSFLKGSDHVPSITHRIHVCYLYMATFTINIPPMLAYIPYMDPMGSCSKQNYSTKKTSWMELHKHLATILEKVSNKKNGWYNSPSCWLRVISGWFRPKSTRLSTT